MTRSEMTCRTRRSLLWTIDRREIFLAHTVREYLTIHFALWREIASRGMISRRCHYEIGARHYEIGVAKEDFSLRIELEDRSRERAIFPARTADR